MTFKVGDEVTVNSGRGASNKTTSTIVELGTQWATVERAGRMYSVKLKSLLPAGEKSKRAEKREHLAAAREQIEQGHVLVGSTVKAVGGVHEGKVGVVKRLGYDTVYVAFAEDGDNPPRRVYPQDLETISVPDPKATAEIHESGLMVDDVVRYVGPESALTGLFLVVTGYLADGRIVVTDEDGDAWYVDHTELSITPGETQLPPEPEPPKDPTFAAGTRVKFIGGGPEMIVSHKDKLDEALCVVWWDATRGYFETRYFNHEILVEVK